MSRARPECATHSPPRRAQTHGSLREGGQDPGTLRPLCSRGSAPVQVQVRQRAPPGAAGSQTRAAAAARTPRPFPAEAATGAMTARLILALSEGKERKRRSRCWLSRMRVLNQVAEWWGREGTHDSVYGESLTLTSLSCVMDHRETHSLHSGRCFSPS